MGVGDGSVVLDPIFFKGMDKTVLKTSSIYSNKKKRKKRVIQVWKDMMAS